MSFVYCKKTHRGLPKSFSTAAQLTAPSQQLSGFNERTKRTKRTKRTNENELAWRRSFAYFAWFVRRCCSNAWFVRVSCHWCYKTSASLFVVAPGRRQSGGKAHALSTAAAGCFASWNFFVVPELCSEVRVPNNAVNCGVFSGQRRLWPKAQWRSGPVAFKIQTTTATTMPHSSASLACSRALPLLRLSRG